jgi:hypothetical protein
MSSSCLRGKIFAAAERSLRQQLCLRADSFELGYWNDMERPRYSRMQHGCRTFSTLHAMHGPSSRSGSLRVLLMDAHSFIAYYRVFLLHSMPCSVGPWQNRIQTSGTVSIKCVVKCCLLVPFVLAAWAQLLPMVKGEVCAAIGFWSMGRATPVVDPLLTLTWYSTDISSPFAAENWKTRDAKRALS